MPGTTLTDIIVPELFNPYVVEKTMELSELVQSGIIRNNTEYNTLASQAAPMVQMPFYEDLNGESEQIIEGGDLTDEKITSNKDISVILRRAKMWSATDLSAAMSGSDPMAAIGSLIAGFWSRDMQKELIAVLKGIFGTTTASEGSAAETRLSSNILDISSGTGAASKWSGAAFIDAQQLLGDAKSQLTAIAMHSAVESALRKQDLIETQRPSDASPFNTYMGKRIIIDDGCPYTGGGANMVFSTYLFGDGAIALGNGSPVGFVSTETDRAKRKGSGVDYLINRKTYILHPRGISWTNADVAKTEGPSRAEVAKAENWKPVFEAKKIRIVEFKHKI